jgi:hypothetical protein
MAKQTTTKSWREVLPVHPAVEVFPMMSNDKLDAPGPDVEAHGLGEPVTFWQSEDGDWYLLDGRSRLAAIERAVLRFGNSRGSAYKAVRRDIPAVRIGSESWCPRPSFSRCSA